MNLTFDNSRHECVLCGSMLEYGDCGVCGVNQAKAIKLIRNSGTLDFLDLCETVKTSDSFDARTKSLFRRLAKTLPVPTAWKPRRIWLTFRAHYDLSAALLSMTNIDYQMLIVRTCQTTAVHNAKEEMRRFLCPLAILIPVSIAISRWLTEGLQWQVLAWPALAVALLAIAEKPLNFVLDRFAKPMKRGFDVAEVPLHLGLAVLRRSRVPWYLQADFWWLSMISVSVIVVSLL